MYVRVDRSAMTRFIRRSTFEIPTHESLGPVATRPGRPCGLHAGDESLDAFVDGPERVLAQHRALSLIVELEVHPVDGEVTARSLCGTDELTAKLGPRGLRRLVDRGFDVLVGGDPGSQPLALQ